jgi:hypothetical protein
MERNNGLGGRFQKRPPTGHQGCPGIERVWVGKVRYRDGSKAAIPGKRQIREMGYLPERVTEPLAGSPRFMPRWTAVCGHCF